MTALAYIGFFIWMYRAVLVSVGRYRAVSDVSEYFDMCSPTRAILDLNGLYRAVSGCIERYRTIFVYSGWIRLYRPLLAWIGFYRLVTARIGYYRPVSVLGYFGRYRAVSKKISFWYSFHGFEVWNYYFLSPFKVNFKCANSDSLAFVKLKVGLKFYFRNLHRIKILQKEAFQKISAWGIVTKRKNGLSFIPFISLIPGLLLSCNIPKLE